MCEKNLCVTRPYDESSTGGVEALADYGSGSERFLLANSRGSRLDPVPGSEDDATKNSAPGTSHRGRTGSLERETGFEPATLSLGREDEPEEDQ